MDAVKHTILKKLKEFEDRQKDFTLKRDNLISQATEINSELNALEQQIKEHEEALKVLNGKVKKQKSK